jgi:hypothetical protein
MIYKLIKTVAAFVSAGWDPQDEQESDNDDNADVS